MKDFETLVTWINPFQVMFEKYQKMIDKQLRSYLELVDEVAQKKCPDFRLLRTVDMTAIEGMDLRQNNFAEISGIDAFPALIFCCWNHPPFGYKSINYAIILSHVF